MARCRHIREQLTAWVDEQLQDSSLRRVERHLSVCSDCRAEAAALRQSVIKQTALLQRVGTSRADVSMLWNRVAATIQSEAPRRSFIGIRSMAALSAAAGVALIVVVGALGGPDAVLVPIGVKRPPAKLQNKPNLFQEYPIIERLEILENLDTVEAVPLDEEPATDEG